MSASKLGGSVVRSPAIAQVVWTEPTAPAAAEDPAAEPDVNAAALYEQVKLLNTAPNTFGMGVAVAIEGDTVVGAPYIALNGIQLVRCSSIRAPAVVGSCSKSCSVTSASVSATASTSAETR